MRYLRCMRYAYSVLLGDNCVHDNLQTGWGTRAGIGDPAAATAAATANASDEKLQGDAQKFYTPSSQEPHQPTPQYAKQAGFNVAYAQ